MPDRCNAAAFNDPAIRRSGGLVVNDKARLGALCHCRRMNMRR
jgi:hypothetical protein